MAQPNAYTEVMEVIALLQHFGYNMKSLEKNDLNVGKDEAIRTVAINCQASELRVVMESVNTTGSCPLAPSNQNGGFWEVPGVTGGKQYSEECGSGLLGSLPKSQRERLMMRLQDMIKLIKEYSESELQEEKHKECLENNFGSMINLKTPERRMGTYTDVTYRSLDTLTAAATTAGNAPQQLPAPGTLLEDATEDNAKEKKTRRCLRKDTYTISTMPGSSKKINKTSRYEEPKNDDQQPKKEQVAMGGVITD